MIVPISELPVEESEREAVPALPRSIRGRMVPATAESFDHNRIVLAERRAEPPFVGARPPQMSVESINQMIHQFLIAQERYESLSNRAVTERTPGGREISFIGNSFSQAAQQASRAMRNLGLALRNGIIATNNGTIRETPNGSGSVIVNRGNEVSVDFRVQPENHELETNVTVTSHEF